MSTQDTTTTIHLSHAPDGTGYKLLELPPELQELLESQDAPTLTLHSSPTAALLKTPSSRTYSLRQKNTSNALILLAPTAATTTTTTTTSSTGDPETALSGTSSCVGLSAIATVHETIELVPEAEGEAAAAAPKARGKWHERFGRGR
ncbi:hypothetical protein VTI74DRAFT_3789 [Chaetomium olivicolor]